MGLNTPTDDSPSLFGDEGADAAAADDDDDDDDDEDRRGWVAATAVAAS